MKDGRESKHVSLQYAEESAWQMACLSKQSPAFHPKGFTAAWFQGVLSSN